MEYKNSREKFLDRVLDASLCGIYVYDVIKGRNDYINQQYTNITGWTLKEINAMSSKEFAALFHPDDQSAVFSHMDEVKQADNQQPVEIEYRFKTKRGHWIWCLSRDAAFEKSPNGELVRFIGTFIDITERKNATIELQQMDKLKSLGILAGGIAHDFNNILLGIYGNIAIAKSKIDTNDEAYEFLDDAEKSMTRATNLTKQLLTFSKGGEPIKEIHNLKQLISDTVKFDLSGSQVKLILDIDSDLWPVKVDKGQLEQVFSNLTRNAIQSMPNGGKLYISLSNTKEKISEKLGLKPRKFINISIRDEGTGINPEHLSKIFDPYFTTKQSGSGLGLATIHSIIKKHNGEIKVESNLTSGTTFNIYLPASSNTDTDNNQSALSETSTNKLNLNILIMDDDTDVSDVIAKMLIASGCSVQTTTDGAQALQLYQDNMHTVNAFDIVIMDLTIPGGMGGKETIKQLLKIDEDAKVIVSSGYTDDMVLVKYTSYGFKGRLLKPYTKDQLLDVLQSALN